MLFFLWASSYFLLKRITHSLIWHKPKPSTRQSFAWYEHLYSISESFVISKHDDYMNCYINKISIGSAFSYIPLNLAKSQLILYHREISYNGRAISWYYNYIHNSYTCQYWRPFFVFGLIHIQYKFINQSYVYICINIYEKFRLSAWHLSHHEVMFHTKEVMINMKTNCWKSSVRKTQAVINGRNLQELHNPWRHHGLLEQTTSRYIFFTLCYKYLHMENAVTILVKKAFDSSHCKDFEIGTFYYC